MEYGIGIDASLGLKLAEQRELVGEAKASGYASAWTPSGPATRDSFQVCGQWAGEGLPRRHHGHPGAAVDGAIAHTQAGTLHEITAGSSRWGSALAGSTARSTGRRTVCLRGRW